MSEAYGIDLGTTNSVIARLEGGRPVPIPIDGSPIVPSVVLWDGERVAVGREARNLELLYPERTVRSVKRRMGQDHRYRVGERELAPEEVSAEILGALKRGAEQATGERVMDAVVTVPAYFDDAQRRATLRAGELAGLNVLRLLNEPTSASLVYEQVGTGAGAEPEIVLVYDLGGGTFDVSVLEVFAGVREVRATVGNTALGGDDFDEKLVQLFLDHLKAKGVNPQQDARAMARLRRLAEDTKIRLSRETEVAVREEFITSKGDQPVHLDLQVTRRQFEELIGPLLATTVELARQAIREARLGEQVLGRICLVGGSTRIPLVRALLQQEFDADVHEEIDADLAVALGAAIQSGLLQGAPVERILVDVAAHSLGIRVVGPDDRDYYFGAEPDTFAPVLRRNTPLPAARSEEFYTVTDDQEKLHVDVFQGESPRVSANTRVGAFDFPLLPMPGGSPVSVEFQYDLNGVVRVEVAQAGTDNRKSVALAVADAARPAEAAPAGPVERKARKLLETLAGKERTRLDRLLETYLQARGRAREEAEDALLDFLMAMEDED